MKRDRFYNTYFPNNGTQSTKQIAFVQTVERKAGEEPVIRIVDIETLSKVPLEQMRQMEKNFEFMAYDPTGPSDQTLNFHGETKLSVFGLQFVFIKERSEWCLFVTTSAGCFIFHGPDLKKCINIHERPHTYVFTGIAAAGSNIFISHYDGKIEKITFVVDRFHLARLHQVSCGPTQRNHHYLGKFGEPSLRSLR